MISPINHVMDCAAHEVKKWQSTGHAQCIWMINPLIPAAIKTCMGKQRRGHQFVATEQEQTTMDRLQQNSGHV